MSFPLKKDQRIHFKGRDGAARALRFANTFSEGVATVEGSTVIIKRDTELTEKQIKLADFKGVDFGASLEHLEMGHSGRTSAERPQGRITYG